MNGVTSTTGAVPYAQALTSQEVPPPYFFPGVTTHGFVIDVSLPQVQRYCDTMLNLGDPDTRGFVYRAMPAWPYALVLFIQYPTMICSPRHRENMGGTVAYSYRGAVSQTEVFIAIPVVRYGTSRGGVLVNTTVDWALPFIVVGNPMSASCGREMLGMGKLLAEVPIGEAPMGPGTLPGSFHASVKLPGWKTAADDEIQDPALTFLEVVTKPAMPTHWGKPEFQSPWSLLQTRAGGDFVAGLAGLMGFVNGVTMGTLPLTMRTVSLKQFRDAAEPEQALYQALVTCRSKYTNVENVRFFNERDVQLTFHNHASFSPILEIFMDEAKLQGDSVWVTPLAAYSLNATVSFDEMRTIYRAPIDPNPGVTPAPGAPFSDIVATWARPWVGFFGGGRAQP